MTPLRISRAVSIPAAELQFTALRARGPGGQHVNKAATGVQLRFDIAASSLPEVYRQRLLALSDQRITQDGCIVIRADGARSQQRNRQDALARLADLVRSVAVARKVRRPTRPGRAARQRRLDSIVRRGRTKALRGKVKDD